MTLLQFRAVPLMTAPAVGVALSACSEKQEGAAASPQSVAAPASTPAAAPTPEPAPTSTPAPALEEADDDTLTIDLTGGGIPWTGDLDAMIERRFIRVLTVNSKTLYFIDRGVQRGTAVDFVRAFEQELNAKLLADNKKRKDKGDSD